MDPGSSFELIAELSLATIGFAGIAAVFGGAERAYLPFDRARLFALLGLAGMSLAGALLFQVLHAANLSLQTSVNITTTASLAAITSTMAIVLPSLYRAKRSPEVENTTLATNLAATLLSSSAALLILALVLQDGPWALLGGLTIQLLTAVLLFARLLVVRN
jgi:hypothetical protein